MLDHPVTDWHPDKAPVPTSTHGGRRPLLRAPLSTFTVHYAGAGRAWLDAGDTAAELRSIESYAQGAGKPWEYNSVSDSAGETWEYAGRYQAAHSSGDNAWAWGHLVLYGLEPLTDATAAGLILGIRRARAQLVAAGMLTPDHAVTPHRRMPGAATACPGPLADSPTWWAQIAAPLTTTKETPTMRTYFCIDRLGTPDDPRPVWVTTDGLIAYRVPGRLGVPAGVTIDVVPRADAARRFILVDTLEPVA